MNKKMSKKEIKEKAHLAGSKMEEKVKHVKAKITDKARQAQQAISESELSGRAREQFLELYQEHETTLGSVATFIQERPFLSVAIGIFAGLFLGRMFTRR